MNQQDLNRLSMWKAVSQHLQGSEAVWSVNVPFSKAYERIIEAITAADQAILLQSQATTGVAVDKESLEEQCINKVLSVTRPALVFALDQDNHTLHAQIKCSKSGLKRLSQPVLCEKMKGMIQALQLYSAQLEDYGIAAGSFQEALDLISRYEQALPSVRTRVASRVVVSRNVPAIMKAGRMALTRLDNLIHIFEPAHPEFVAGYRVLREIVNSGRRHQNGNGQETA